MTKLVKTQALYPGVPTSEGHYSSSHGYGMLQLGFNNVCPLGTLLTVYAKLTLPLQWSPRQPVKRALLGLEPQLRQKPVADHSTALT
jgi:hypothetical protein